MIVSATQRWRDRRDSYRPAREVIDPKQFEVAAIPGDTQPRAFVEAHHYSGSYPAARFRFGLWRSSGELAGVAVFSVPCRAAVLSNVFGTEVPAVELGRFVLLDDVAANGESWFLSRCFRELRHEVDGVVAFSDPEPRRTATGRTVFAGHIGNIYQASSANFRGRATARTLRLLPDGRVFSDRTAQKIRAQERGWRYAVEQLVDAGARPPETRDLRAWLAVELERVTRRLRHPGNLRYAFPLSRAARCSLAESLPYPKIIVPQQRRLFP